MFRIRKTFVWLRTKNNPRKKRRKKHKLFQQKYATFMSMGIIIIIVMVFFSPLALVFNKRVRCDLNGIYAYILIEHCWESVVARFTTILFCFFFFFIRCVFLINALWNLVFQKSTKYNWTISFFFLKFYSCNCCCCTILFLCK